MNLLNPSNLYSGDAVVLNTKPLVDSFMNMQAKKQARQDALDKYYNQQLESVKPEGMRPQDLQSGDGYKGWVDKVNEWKQFALDPTNKKLIQHPELDGGKARNTYNLMHNSLLSAAQTSKRENETDKTVAEAHLNGKLDMEDPNNLSIAHDKTLSIYDPNRKIPSGSHLGQLTPVEKQFDNDKFVKGIFTGIAPDKKPDYTQGTLNKETGMYEVPVVQSFSPDVQKAIGNKAHDIVIGNPAAYKFYNNALHDPETLQRLQSAAEGIFGAATNADGHVVDDKGNLILVDTPEKAAKAALALEAKNRTATLPGKQSLSVDEWNRRAQQMEGYKLRNIGANKASTNVTPNQIPNPMDNYDKASQTIVPPSPTLMGVSVGAPSEPYKAVTQNLVSPEDVKKLGKPFTTPDGQKVYKIVNVNGERILQSPQAGIRESEMQQTVINKDLNTAQKARVANKFPPTTKTTAPIKTVKVKGL